jgi:DNA-binding MarR family transcriptional regulator
VGLLEEIRQTKPFRSPRHETVLSILKTADTVRRRIGETIHPHGLSLEQYNVLRILRGAGDAGLPTLEVAARMIEQTPAITRLLDKLEAKGFVRRVRSDSDRRQVFCWITPEGLQLLSGLDEAFDRSESDLLNGLSEHEIQPLLKILEKIRATRR